MRRNNRRSSKFVVVAAGLLLCSANVFVSAQKSVQTEKSALAEFEKSIEQGKIVEIERPLLDYAVAHPQNPRALELLAKLRARQNRWQEAKGLYQRALTIDANSVAAKIGLGKTLLELGQRGEAQRIFTEIAQLDSLNPLAQLQLTAALLSVGDAAQALTVADKLPPELKNNEALPVIAAILAQLGEREKLTALFPLMKKTRANPRLSLQCAEVLRQVEMPLQAIELLNLTLAANPKNPQVLISLGKSEILVKEFAKARQHINRAAAMQPTSAETLSAQAMLENAEGNHLAAFVWLKKAVAVAPDSPVVLTDFVVAAMRANQPKTAVDHAAVLLTIKPDDADFLYLFGAASLQNGDLSQAQKTLERFVQARPGDARGCLAFGLALAAQRDRFAAARQQFERCLEIDANNYEAAYQLGLSYKTAGETLKAIEYLEAVAKQAPNYAAALRDLGALYLQNGSEAKARTVLEQSVALNQTDADTHFQLSRLYNLIGESALAKRHFDFFQKLKNPVGK